MVSNLFISLCLLGINPVSPADSVGQFQHAPADTGKVVVSKGSVGLREVIVSAQKPLVSQEIDRLGYDVQADPDVRTTTIIEMLRKVPLVAVDGEKRITINGSSSFLVFKNGKPNAIFTKNPKEVFSSMPASTIKRIEVITQPGARYDAEGVGYILNIVTLDNPIYKGIMGNLSLNANSNTDFLPRSSLWLQSQLGKVTFSLNGNGSWTPKNSVHNYSEAITDYANGTQSKTFSHNTFKDRFTFVSGEASYEADTLNLFTLEFQTYHNPYHFFNDGTRTQTGCLAYPSYSYSTTATGRYNAWELSTQLSYQHTFPNNKGHFLTANYLFTLNNANNSSFTSYEDTVDMPVDYTEQTTLAIPHSYTHTLQTDYTLPFAKTSTIEVGAKAIFRSNTSDNTNTYGSLTETAKFTHSSEVAAAYLQYTLRLNKFSLRGGIRYEYSHLKSETWLPATSSFSSSFNDIVPSASLSWNASNASFFSLNYSRTIARPGLYYLNPTHIFTPTTDSYGNPDLSCAARDGLSLSYRLIKRKISVNLSSAFNWSNSGIVAITTVDPQGIINNTYGNVGRMRTLIFSAYMQWSLTKTTRWIVNGSVSWRRYAQTGLENSGWGWNINTNLSQRLPWKMRAQFMMFKSVGAPSSVYVVWCRPAFFRDVNYVFSLGKDFLKDDRLNVYASIQNPFGPNYPPSISSTINGDYTGQTNAWGGPRRNVSIGVSLRFGSLNAEVKHTNKSISNSDTVGASASPTN